MRSLKKLLAVLLALTMVLSIMVVPAFAAESLEYEDEAKVLYDLGLFKGKSATEFVPDLESRLERQDGVALVLRLFNLDTEAEKMSESEAKALLAEKFTDADEIAAWAVKYVAYAVKNEIVNGRPDGKFAPKDPLLGKEYAKMILAQLGQYDPNNFQTACADLAAISNLSSAEAIKFNDKILIRDDVVGISFASLAGEYADGSTVIAKLAAANAELKAKAIELGLIAVAKVNTVIEPIAIKVGEAVELPAKVEVEYADGSVAEVDVAWDTSAVKADVAGEYKAVGTIAAYDGTIEVVVTVTPDVLAVESVTADNLKEVVVVFNQDVSENAEVAKTDNYKLDISKKVESVTVDGNTAILTIENDGNDIENQKAAKLTITNKILAAEEKFDFTFFDAELPEVLGIEVTGPKSVQINFSEPIALKGKITLKKGSSTLSVSTNYNLNGKSEVNVPMYSSFVDGETYEITIKEFEDYAGYANIVKTIEFVYEKDETAPVATIDSATQKYVKVSFNKPVKGLTKEHFSHTFSAWKSIKLTTKDTFTSTEVTKTDSVTEVYVWFYNDGSDKENERAIPEGETSFRVITKNSAGDEIKDEWGNKLAEVNTTISVVADKTAPEVSEVTVVAENEIKVKFSKNVSKFDKDNIEVLDTDGNKIDGVKLTISGSGKEFNVKLGKDLPGKTILVNIKDVVDTTLSANKMEPYSTTLEITDKKAPTVNLVTYEIKRDNANKFEEAYLYVFFNEALDSESALKVSNYFIYDTDYAKLTKSATFFSGDKIVKIALTEAESQKIAAIATIQGKGIFVTGVKDTAGNEVNPRIYKVDGTQASANVPAIDVKDAVKQVKATASDKIEVVFNQELASITSDAFTVKSANKSYSVIGMDVLLDSGKTKAILTIEPALPYDIKYVHNGNAEDIKLTVDGTKLENLFGVKGKASDVAGADKDVAIVDKVAPAVDSIVAGDIDKQIVVTFKENIKNENVALFAHDFVITNEDDKELVPAIDYTTALNGNKVTITINKAYGKYAIAFRGTVNYIKDAAGNVASKFDEKTIEVKDQKPAVSTAITAQIAAVNGSAKVVFTKALDADSKTAVENAISAATAKGTLTFSWSEDGLTLTVNNTHATDATEFAGKVTVNNVADAAGNTADVVVVDIAAAQ